MIKFGVAIDFQGLLSEHSDLLSELSDPDKVLRGGVMDLYAMISERIQQQGLKTDGTPIGGGRGYSQKYKAIREAAGRQTDYIDLTFSGDMLDRGFIPGPTGVNSFGLGFINQLEYDKMELHEFRYGAIIQASPEELAQAFDLILKDIANVIRRRN